MSAESIAKALADPVDEPEEVIAIAASRVDAQARMTQSASYTT